MELREQFSSNFEGVFLTGCVLQDVKASQVRAILDYMYRGEVSVAQDELPSLLRVAEMLKVKGMTEENTKADTKLPAPRCSSPGSGAPPNSIVPPNGESPAPAPVTSSEVVLHCLARCAAHPALALLPAIVRSVYRIRYY